MAKLPLTLLELSICSAFIKLSQFGIDLRGKRSLERILSRNPIFRASRSIFVTPVGSWCGGSIDHSHAAPTSTLYVLRPLFSILRSASSVLYPAPSSICHLPRFVFTLFVPLFNRYSLIHRIFHEITSYENIYGMFQKVGVKPREEHVAHIETSKRILINTGTNVNEF